MKKIVVILFATVMISSFQSCKKKKEDPAPTAKELISEDDWTEVKVEHYDASGNLQYSNSVNNKVVFTPSGHYYYYDDTGNIVTYGTWELSNDNKKITIRNTNFNQTYDIKKLTRNKFYFLHDYSTIINGNKQGRILAGIVIYYNER